MTQPERASKGRAQRDTTSKPLAERVREILQGLLEAGDELAAGLFGPRRLQPAMIPLPRRPQR
jgi:hypothetical protein